MSVQAALESLMESWPIGGVFLCGLSGIDILNGAYGNKEIASVICESQLNENENTR